jgi:hypothetical protein
MAITSKPKRNTVEEKSTNSTIDERKAIAFINQGGSVAFTAKEPQLEDEDKQKAVIVRMYPDMIKEIDDLLKFLPKRNRPSRNTWIIQAIEEKLKRDKKHLK